VATSLLGVSCLFGAGVLWGEHPPAPRWWLLDTEWWFIGGWGTGTTLIISGLLALALLVYSFRRFRGNPYDHEAEQKREAERHAERRRQRAASPRAGRAPRTERTPRAPGPRGLTSSRDAHGAPGALGAYDDLRF